MNKYIHILACRSGVAVLKKYLDLFQIKIICYCNILKISIQKQLINVYLIIIIVIKIGRQCKAERE